MTPPSDTMLHPEIERLDHPWVQDYFNGPRGRAAREARDRDDATRGRDPMTERA